MSDLVLGARFVLMYPQQVERLVLESPIGLEDYRLKRFHSELQAFLEP